MNNMTEIANFICLRSVIIIYKLNIKIIANQKLSKYDKTLIASLYYY